MREKIHATTGGYNDNLFIGKSQEELDEIKCGVCLEAWRDPHQCPNGHVYCQLCIYNDGEQKLKRCPECQEEVDNWIPNLVAKKNVEKLVVKCISSHSKLNAKRSCKWKGPLHSLKQHVQVHCLFTIVKCSHEGCEAKVKRANFLLHESECEFRLENCFHCNKRISVVYKQAHEDKCNWRYVDCDLECGERIMLKDLKAHKTKDCHNYFVPCPMYQLTQTCSGCNGEVKRCEMESHLTNPDVLPSNFMTLLTAVLEMKQGKTNANKKRKRK